MTDEIVVGRIDQLTTHVDPMPRKDHIRPRLAGQRMPDDVIDLVAKEVAAQVADHIETMYPDAAKAVAWNSCKRSIQGVARNSMSRLGKAAEDGSIEKVLADMKKQRQKFKRDWRAVQPEQR